MTENEFWWDGFALPDLDGWANCALVFDGSVVIGGRFTQVGGSPARNVARWDGAHWSALGSGFDGDVLSLAVYRGELIASGRFDHSGGGPLRGIARWSGAGWVPVGGGLWLENTLPSIGATALAVNGNVLYAAGGFDRAGGMEARHVASWNGAEWSALGGGLDSEAQSLLILGDSLYVGGSFREAGGHAASGVALWDGQEWFQVGGGISSADGHPYVFDMVAYQGTLVATGFFDSAGGAAAHNLAAWNGNEWRVLGESPDDGLPYGGTAIVVRGDTLLVGGYGLRVWDGAGWGYPSLWLSGWLSCLLDGPMGLVVGGVFTAYDLEGGIAAVNIGIHRDAAWDDLVTWTDRMRGLNRAGYVWGVPILRTSDYDRLSGVMG